MSTITLPNIRVSSDLTVKVRLKDGGVAIDWSTLSNIRALIYADAQRAMAGRCAVSIDAEDATLLVCQYAANKPQYLGVNRIVVSATYLGETKTYDKPALKFVRWTDDQAGQEITISDPDVDVEIEVEDISSSILQEAVDAAFSAAERADDAAAAAEHMVDIHQGPPGPAGKSPYIDETTGHWFVWDDNEEQYVDTEEDAQGPQGDPGPTPQITVGQTATGLPGSDADVSVSGTAAAPILNFTIPQGEPGVAAVKYVQVAELPTASSHTLDALYLVPTQTEDVFDVYYTSRDGQSTYSWVKLCTTSAQLSDYATKAEVTQLEHELHNLSGKYYGVFPTSGDLPDDATTPGYAFVGAENPYAIWNFDGEEWSDSGSVANGITGEPGVGFDSAWSLEDGTFVIVLTSGDTITFDLNHNHPNYFDKLVGSTIPAGGLVPDVAYKLGTLTGAVTITLASAVSGCLNHYFFTFDTSASAPTITFPVSVTKWDGNCVTSNAPVISASKHYEVSILDGVGVIYES